MTGRGIGLILGLTGMIVAGMTEAQTSAVSASSSSSAPKPKTTAVAAKLVTTPKPLAPSVANAAAKPAATTANAKPLVADAKPVGASGAAPGTPMALKPKPAVIPVQPKTVPAECLTFDTSPFGTLQGLDVVGPGHARAHFDVEIASAPAQRGQGLMCRQTLPPGQGMLFEFPKASEQIFWMHDTVLPLDILYIAPDGHVVSITRGARPLSDAKLPSHGLSNGVLEIRAGLADKLGLKPGDQVVYPFFVSAVPIVAPVAAASSASTVSSTMASSSPAQ
jgi:uncharacterized membrane protein (UPF0127 family)